jgi:VIT1/CCC1 family predicted Fe2+/Mn2+ transporter
MGLEALRPELLAAQRNEITEHRVYSKLAKSVRDPHNREILERIARDELRHYGFFKGQTGIDLAPSRWRSSAYLLISKVFGITFGLKLMERGEEKAQATYQRIAEHLQGIRAIAADEHDHEKELVGLLDEERLRYVGSVVLGLNDALVELTGALAGLSLALRTARLVAVAGLITGIAASFSMAASEYLSTKSEGGPRNPVKSMIYTGVAYVLTVLFLIMPFLFLTNVYHSLAVTIFNAIVVILVFTFYISVAKDQPFKRRFLEMAGISLGVAGLSFCIGLLVRTVLPTGA